MASRDSRYRNLGCPCRRGQSTRRPRQVDEAILRGVKWLGTHFSARQNDEYVTDADNQRTFELLSAEGFKGFFSVEVINPDDSGEVLAHHIAKFRGFMRAAG